MFDSNIFFRNPTLSTDDILRSSLEIFLTKWQIFTAISIAQTMSIFGLDLIAVFIFINIYAPDTLKSMNACMATDSKLGVTRFLVNYIYENSSRLLAEYYYQDGKYYADNDSCDYGEIWGQIIKMAFPFVTLNFVLIVGHSIISSTFGGAMIHAVAEMFSGRSPSISRSITLGWKKMSKVFCFRFLLLIGTISGGLTTCLLALSLNHRDLVLLILIFLPIFSVLFIVLSSVMIGGVPSIVLEGKSFIQAFHRSWILCKDSICFIACTMFCLYGLSFFLLAVVVFLVEMMMKNIVGNSSIAIEAIGFVAISALDTITTVTIYISLRIRLEEFKRLDLAKELSLSEPDPQLSTVEMANVEERITLI